MFNLTYGTNEPVYKAEIDSQTYRTDLRLPRGWGRDGLGVWDQQMQTTIYKTDKQKGPTVQHREYIQYPEIKHNGKEYICILNHFAVQQKLTQHCKSTIL